MTSESRVTTARYDKKQDMDILIATFVVSRMLIQRYKALIDGGSLGQV